VGYFLNFSLFSLMVKLLFCKQSILVQFQEKASFQLNYINFK
jgi:hypothetical protein